MASSSASSVPLSSGSVITVSSSSAVGGSSGSTGGAAGGGGGGTGSPCAACKFLRRKCQPDCVFAPYFPPDNPQKFVHVHRVFGASNVTKLLNELSPYQREDAVNSLAYEADMRLRDPVYGCVGVISVLQHQLRQLQQDLTRARYELSKYQAAAAAAVVSSSNGPPAMADFIGSTVPNCTQNFINVGHTAAAAIGGAAAGGGFVHDQFATVQTMLTRTYDGGESAVARLGVNGSGGGYEFGYSSAMNAGGPMSGLGPLGGGTFLKPGTAAGRGERPTAAQ
ncbi:LOB domain-containing protein 6-like [Oryza brachyantha]|uniref:LOB domain-containing protein 6-like n=1 Tax=Oryza brachyantha TaxID=4533 RepID=UPI001ADBB0E3|nr:LOB domain-containing protein 6-like [Oryza brachyantha]